MTTNTSIVGLDLSTKSTGVCAGGQCDTIAAKQDDPFQRAQTIRTGVAPYATAADLIVIEGYGTQFVHTAYVAGLLHGLILDAIDGIDRVMVPPGVVKRYATYNGNANKTAMIESAQTNGADVANDDEADAWWLWAIGCHINGTPVVWHNDDRDQIARTYTRLVRST